MKRILLATGVALLATAALAAAPSLAPEQKAAICGKRASCTIAAAHLAGDAQVAEVHFALKDRPSDAPDDGCGGPASDKHDGGIEYWLLGARPAKVLALCNDGYGAAGVGEDAVSFAPNRMTHVQSGGSNWRWTNTDIFSLSPFRLLTETGCSYFDAGNQGTASFVDYARFRAIAVSRDYSYHWAENDVGCPQVTPALLYAPRARPDAKSLVAFPLLTPADGETQFHAIAPGTSLGSCATRLSTDGRASGFLVWGTPAAPANTAELRVLAPNAQTLLLQIYDPVSAAPPAGKSWLAGSHVEIWVLKNTDTSKPLTRADLEQVAIDLDGTVHPGGPPRPEIPAVRHWSGKDERGRPVTILLIRYKETYTLPIGTAVVYSQAEDGRQVRLVATTGMARGVPLYVPGLTTMQNHCAIASGRLDLR
jgi:hypothetical protein